MAATPTADYCTAPPGTRTVRMGLGAPSGGGGTPFTVQQSGVSYGTLAAAIAAAQSGNTILVVPGVYNTINTLVTKPLTIKSTILGARWIIDGAGIFGYQSYLLAVDNGVSGAVVLEDIGLINNKYQDGRNSGFATLGPTGPITLRRFYIGECSNGVLTGNQNNTCDLLLDNGEVVDCGTIDGLTHNIYIGNLVRVRMRGVRSHWTRTEANYLAGESWRVAAGHAAKSRALETDIQGCYLDMGPEPATGGPNRNVDIPNGGKVFLAGNTFVFRTKNNAGRGHVVAMGVEGQGGIVAPAAPDIATRVYEFRCYQNTVLGMASSQGGTGNSHVFWFADSTGANNMPALAVYEVKDNIFAGWIGNPPTVIQGTPQVASTTYAISNTLNTCGALSLLTDAANGNYIPVTPVAGAQNWATLAWSAGSSTGTVARSDVYRGGVDPSVPAIQLSGGVWTPNRISGGRPILATDWAQLPLNTEVEAAGSLFSAAYETPVPVNIDGSSDGVGYLSVWSGAAWDYVTQQMYFGPNGGHRTRPEHDTGLYALDSSTMDYRLVLGRSAYVDQRQWDGVSGLTHSLGGWPFNNPQADGRAGSVHLYDNTDWLPPGTPGCGPIKGGLYVGGWVRQVYNLDTLAWSTPHWYNPNTSPPDWSYGIGFFDGTNQILSPRYDGFALHAWRLDQTETTSWTSTSFGRFYDSKYTHSTRSGTGPKTFAHLRQRREFVVFSGDAAAKRVRYGAAQDAGVTNIEPYIDSITLTSSDGSHADFAAAAYSDSGGGAAFYAAGAAYDHELTCIFFKSCAVGGHLYKITGLSGNTWTTQRISTIGSAYRSLNGMFGKWRIALLGGVKVAIRVVGTTTNTLVTRLT